MYSNCGLSHKYGIKESLEKKKTLYNDKYEKNITENQESPSKPISEYVIKYGTLENMFKNVNSRGKKYINIVLDKNNINITLKANFTGSSQLYLKDFKKTYEEVVIDGFKSWSGNYTDVFGFDAVVNVNVEKSKDGMPINLSDDYGRAMVYLGADEWAANNDMSMNSHTRMKAGDGTDISVDKDGKMRYAAAHEFGHVLGLNDAYKEDERGRPNAKESDSEQLGIMKNQWKGININENDIQMMLYAFETNKFQSYSDYTDVVFGIKYYRSEGLKY